MNKKIVAGILAHVDTGKTTLSESLLYETGVIRQQGRVDNKDAYLDTDELERERGITIYSKTARIPLNDKEIILIDTPGHVDFSTEMERALSVLDVAILMVSGSSGVQSHTKTLWSLLKSYKIPTFIFVNKMDMEGADKDSLLSSMKEKLSSEIVCFDEPYSDNFYEDIATLSEDLLNEYLDTGKVNEDKIKELITKRLLFPAFFGSALKNEGIKEFILGLNNFLPNNNSVSSNDTDDFSGIVYKISRSNDNKRLTFLKILAGSLKLKDMLGDEKVNEIRLYNGEKYESVKEAFKGEICALPNLENTKNKDCFGNVPKQVSPILSPAISYAIKYPDDVDRTTMFNILKELEDEDPSINVEYQEQTRQIMVSLMGEVQTQILIRTIMDRYNIAVTFTDGKICYKETICDAVEGVGHFEPLRHYAEVHIKLEPLEAGSGLQFESDISTDILEKNWQRLIYTHMIEKEHRGVLTGSPITDLKMTLVSGRAHIKHTEGGDFRQATYRAIRQGLMVLRSQNSCRILEPYYDYTLEVPSEYVGRAMTDITNMSGTANIAETNIAENITILTGRAPVSTMNGYTKDVISYTKGLGKLSLYLFGYDKCHNEEEILQNSKYDPESDTRNTPDSVFCSHGSGTIIPWYEVPDYMHLEYGIGSSKAGNTELLRADTQALKEAAYSNRQRKNREAAQDISISLEEIDDILRRNSFLNENGRQGSYKGISKSQREKRRYDPPANTDNKYKGSKIKEKYILVDGYNVIHAWDELNKIAESTLPGAVGRLNDLMCNYQAIENIHLMVVYDAYKVKGHRTEENEFNNITVVYTKEAQTADQYIEQYAHENSSKYDITVITSDGLEQIIVTGNGASLISSREFEEIVKRKFQNFNEQFNVTSED